MKEWYDKSYFYFHLTFRLYAEEPEVMNISSEDHFHSRNHANHILCKMENYLKEKKLCDVLLIAGPLKIPAHR